MHGRGGEDAARGDGEVHAQRQHARRPVRCLPALRKHAVCQGVPPTLGGVLSSSPPHTSHAHTRCLVLITDGKAKVSLGLKSDTPSDCLEEGINLVLIYAS